tara:strand:+ start:4312 stop:5616 length:1305 start_codon:yes stop_codon:yes gene_type:complete
MTPNEYTVIMFIFDRTLGWGKVTEYIPSRHFLEGLRSDTGMIYAPSVGMSERTLRNALRSLDDKGMIHRDVDFGCRSKYGINFEWKTKTEDMKTPKRLKKNGKEGLVNSTKGVGKIYQGGEQDLPTHRREEKEEEENQNDSHRQAMEVGHVEIETREEIMESIKKVESASRLKRDAKKRDGYYSNKKDQTGFIPSVAAMQKTWFDLSKKHFPSFAVSGLPSKGLHMLKSYAREWSARNAGKEWVDFLEWIFQNWSAIGRTEFNWMTNRSEVPTIPLVVSAKLRVSLEKAWGDREALETIYAMTPREREVAFLMRDRGITEKQARKMAKEKEDILDESNKLGERKQKLELERRALEGERIAFGATKRKSKKRDDHKAQVKNALGELSVEDEQEIIASIHGRSSTKRVYRLGNKPRTSEKRLSDTIENLELPAWED